MGCFGPRLTEEEKYEILMKQEEYLKNYGKPPVKTPTELAQIKEKSNSIAAELNNLAKDSEKRAVVSKRLDKIKAFKRK